MNPLDFSIEATTRHLFTTRHLIEFAGNGFLILAFFVLICAPMMGGVDKWETRLALFIIGGFLTLAGGLCFFNTWKPKLNILEACHRLALIEGQKENKNEMPKGVFQKQENKK